MSIKKILQRGDPLLKNENVPITRFSTEKLKELIGDLKDTMMDRGLVGIAGPQIGKHYQVFITEPRETPFRPKDQSDVFRVFINPVITHVSDEEVVIYEGCGSVDAIGLFGPVTRPKEVTVEAYDEQGRQFRLTCDGILARIILHEYDHLHGLEFLDKVTDPNTLLSYEGYMEHKKNDEALKELSAIRTIDHKFI
jgi:peptide deformylase